MISSNSIRATATTSFFVGGLVWYPRYTCRGCHAGPRAMDPYADVCPRYDVVVAPDDEYWWDREYHPAMERFAYSAPFWRFEIRTGPYQMDRHQYIDCAWGFGNYRPHVVPTHVWVVSERISPRMEKHRSYEREYRPHNYSDRTRDAGSQRPLPGGATERTRSGGTERTTSDGVPGSTDRTRTSGTERTRIDSQPGAVTPGSTGTNRNRTESTSTPATIPTERQRSGSSATESDHSRATDRVGAGTPTKTTATPGTDRVKAEPLVPRNEQTKPEQDASRSGRVNTGQGALGSGRVKAEQSPLRSGRVNAEQAAPGSSRVKAEQSPLRSARVKPAPAAPSVKRATPEQKAERKRTSTNEAAQPTK